LRGNLHYLYEQAGVNKVDARHVGEKELVSDPKVSAQGRRGEARQRHSTSELVYIPENLPPFLPVENGVAIEI